MEKKRNLTIDLLCNDGSPLGVIPPMIDGQGVGGAELSMMSLMKVLASRGHIPVVYNNPTTATKYDGVEYRPLSAFNTRNPRDVLIVYRSPNARAVPMLAGLRKIWWSTDQFTVGNFTNLSHLVDYCVTISEYHTAYHIEHWGIDKNKIGHIDLGVRVEDYENMPEKIPGRMIYCSVPDRGLMILQAAWPLIKRQAPNASLVITSDYRLWGGGSPGNTAYRLAFAGMDDVTFFGRVPRAELVKMQMEAEIHAYPCSYEELFCISVAECQVAGAMPVTTSAGSLKATNEFGILIPGDPKSPQFVKAFAEKVAGLVSSDRDFMEARRRSMIVGAKQRFDWRAIAERWENLFYTGQLP